MFRNTYRVLPALALLAGLPSALHAHRQWLLPSSTILSNADTWVTIDAAVSNEVFFFDHVPLRLTNLTITAPDGTSVQAENTSTGKYRSTFDIHLNKAGTYRVAMVNNTVFANWTENGQPRTFRGTADAFAKEVPAKAEGLQTSRMSSRVETFITNGKPSKDALKPTGVGLELVPVTHPNDLVTGEAFTFQLLNNGKPAAGLTVTLIAGGIRYRDSLGEVKFTTDAEGKFTATVKDPGMYWINTTTGAGRGPGGPGAGPGGPRPAGSGPGGPGAAGPGRMPAGDRGSYTATIEILPQ